MEPETPERERIAHSEVTPAARAPKALTALSDDAQVYRCDPAALFDCAHAFTRSRPDRPQVET